MTSQTLQLLVKLDEAGAMNVARVLNTVNGVRKVAIATEAGSVDIDFDDDATSLQELRAVLRRAGFDVQRSAHGEEGMCCGSCGG